jgi:hypothetical protein
VNSRSSHIPKCYRGESILFAKWAGLHEACHDKIAAHLYHGSEPSSQPSRRTLPSPPPRVSTMNAESQQPTRPEGVHPSIERSHRGHQSCKEGLSHRTSQDRLWLRQHSSYANQGTFPVLLRQSAPGSHVARTRTADELGCVELGLFCADICRVLGRGTNGKESGELSQSVYDAINQLSV